MYSTPNASRALAMANMVLVSKKALANCSPSARKCFSGATLGSIGYDIPLSVLSMILKLETLLRKSDALGA